MNPIPVIDTRLDVLVIDDNVEFAENLVEILGDSVGTVRTAHDLAAARRLLEDCAPDLAFVDLRLPDGDGRDFIRLLESRNPESLSIVLTADASLESAVTCVNSGAFGFLLKDMPVEAVLNSFERARERVLLLRQRNDLESRLAQHERLALIGQMAATLAHEIRNPLMGVSQALEVLLDSVGEPPELKRVVDGIRSRFRNLFELVEELLEFSRPFSLTVRKEGVREIIEPLVLDMHDDGSLDKDIRIEFDIDEGATAVSVDPVHFRSLVRNLLRNSSQALEGADDAAIRISTTPQENHVLVEFRDNGPGLDDPRRVFEPFYTTRTRGTGLGLALVSRIVEAHRGWITAKNQNGACFILGLPIPGTGALRT